MKEFDIIYEKFRFSEATEKSIKDFSNWIFGISIGICTLLIIQIKGNFDFTNYHYAKQFYKIILLLSMVNTLFTGYNKFLILKRDTLLNSNHWLLKNLFVTVKDGKKKSEDISNELDDIIKDLDVEQKKILKIGKFLYISIVSTLTIVILTGVYILTII